MRDAPTWLTLTSCLHAAALDAQRWPAAWAGLCAQLDCEAVFGDGRWQDIAQLAETAVVARRCALDGLGRCGQGPKADDDRRRTCLAVVEHLDVALECAQLHAPAIGRRRS